MSIEIYQNTAGENMVAWIDEQGSHSMFKWAYDEMIANQAKGTIS